ncbi:MAG: 30S ribosomal protein S17 [bacterium]|nr:30S ribosomal protein S17 [bacterium]
MAKQITGTVVSNKADKTVVIAVERRVRHAIYRKAYTVTKKFMAHDTDNACQPGDTVTIEATRPLSARKRWKVIDRKPAAEEGAA